jgi:DNA-binding Lrp family transcriptional regulator
MSSTGADACMRRGLSVSGSPTVRGLSFERWLTVTPARLSSIARTLAGDPEAAFVGSTTGPHNLVAIAVCQDANALHTFLADRIGSLDGVDRMQTALITAYIKRAAPAL